MDVMINQCYLLFMYSLRQGNIGPADAMALAGGLRHCTNLQVLK